jgi:hypothetical protein
LIRDSVVVCDGARQVLQTCAVAARQNSPRNDSSFLFSETIKFALWLNSLSLLISPFKSLFPENLFQWIDKKMSSRLLKFPTTPTDVFSS